MDGSIITYATDKFLSESFENDNFFQIIESPLLGTERNIDLQFLEIKVDLKKGNIEIYKSTHSGRPIYYYLNSKGEFFCSSHIKLLKEVGITIKENKNILPEYFCYRYAHPPHTLFNNIKTLPIGHKLILKKRITKYYIDKIIPYVPPKKNVLKDINDIVNKTDSELIDVVKGIDNSDDKIAVLLSGGLDSSILFKICQEEMGIDKSYSTGYPFDDDSDNREKDYALSAANDFNSDHIYFDTDNKNFLISFIDAIDKAEEPIMHLGTAMDNLLFERGIPDDKKIIINGQGADCVWGTSFHMIHKRNNKPFFRFISHHPFIDIAERISKISNKGQGLINSTKTQNEKKDLHLSNPDNIFWDFDQYGNKEWIFQYYKTSKQELIRNRYSIIENYRDRSFYDKLSLIDAISDISITQNVWSKIGEAHKRILYYPFFHKKMLDIAFSIPWEIKLKRPKRVLYEIARKHGISRLITDRPKSAFAAKPKKWAEKGALLESFVPLASKVINKDELRKMQSNEPSKAMTFFNMLNYSIWKRLIIQGESKEKLIEEIIW